ncbi:metallophosphoesterase [Aliiglaciecola litoralis]|uniref:Calcineurin-like phosphoesterase domain-containing protein n=1 Tax=Aliiglaciecola litoralis TaxID=582857 RepID=A0ABP3WNS3_9ALTE
MNYLFLKTLSVVWLTLLAHCSYGANQQPVSFNTEADIIMVGDTHGAYPELVSILKHAGLVDESLNWQGGASHFVSTGDLMDRGPSSRKIMDLLIKLQQQALQQNGRVHVLLGNHEVLNLTGDWRYISTQEYGEFADDESDEMRANYFSELSDNQANIAQAELLTGFNQRFPKGFFARLEAFMPDGVYGAWLHSLPFVIKINQHVFTHGGLSVKTLDIPLETLNQQLKSELWAYTNNWQKLIKSGRLAATADFSARYPLVQKLSQNSITKVFLKTVDALLYSMNSPNWYRGNAICHPLFEAQLLRQVLSQWQAEHLWVGHTTANTVRQRFDQALFLMDTGMLNSVYRGHPIYAQIVSKHTRTENGAPWHFINAKTGQKVSPSDVPSRPNVHPYNMSDEQVEAFLLTAEITETRKLGEGITNPLKVTLEKDGRTLYAVFKYFDSGKKNRRSNFSNGQEDRFQYDIAAYKLDRLMGLNLVPVAVKREVSGTTGALQVWIDGLINYKKMEKENIEYDGFCDYQRQRRMMDVFDYLIHNEDRNQSNITFTRDDWQLWFIDHTRAFNTSLQRPKMMSRADVIVTPEFKVKLESLNHENLSVLSPYLTTRQINSLLKRRDRLLNSDV